MHNEDLDSTLILAASCFAAEEREAPPPAGTPKAFVLPQSNSFTLKNGMKVTLAQHGSVPMAAVSARVAFGRANEGADQVWLSTLVAELMKELYAPFVRTNHPIIIMDVVSAELTKYAANGFLATKISFINEIANICSRTGADIKMVRQGIGSDRRIGPLFLFPGLGYGGSCFPKDVKAVIRTGAEFGMPLDLLEAVQRVNDRQKLVMLDKLRFVLQGRLEGRTVAVWGLAFKAETDDMRESPAIPLVEGLVAAGARVQAHDPKAMTAAREVFGDRIHYASDPYGAAKGADALAVVTEWLVYRNPNFERLKGVLRQPLIVDGRNLYDPVRLRGMGFIYSGIGRLPA